MPEANGDKNQNKDADVPDISGDHAAAAKDTSLQSDINHRDKRSKYIFHSLQTAGGIGLVASAVFEGNIGRLVTGALNAGRNIWQLTTLFNTKSRSHERKNEVLMNSVSAGTNIPQLLTSASIHEAGAAGSAVVAYALRTTRYKFSRRMAKYRANLPPTGHTAISILIKSTNKVLRYGPSVMLFSRALAQTTDGLSRQDWAAFGAGIAFTTGAVFMALGDRKRSEIAKQIKEEKIEKKRERQQEEREVELIKEMDVERQLTAPSEPQVKGMKKKQKQKPENDNSGNVRSVPKRAAARQPKL